MIRINLLESAKGKNKRAGGSSSPAMPAMEMGDMGSPKLKVLVVMLDRRSAELRILVPAGPPDANRLRRRCRRRSRKTAS